MAGEWSRATAEAQPPAYPPSPPQESGEQQHGPFLLVGGGAFPATRYPETSLSRVESQLLKWSLAYLIRHVDENDGVKVHPGHDESFTHGKAPDTGRCFWMLSEQGGAKLLAPRSRSPGPDFVGYQSTGRGIRLSF